MTTTNSEETLVRCHDLGIGHGRNVLMSGIRLSISRGDWLALVGPNGAGKTTLLHTLLGLIPPLAGELWRSPGLRIGYVPQRGQHDLIFPLSALDVVRGGGGSKGSNRLALACPDAAVAALEQVGLGHLTTRMFRELSGGQQQRVSLARALVRAPDLLALDEPTAGMDIPAERELMDLVQRLSKERALAVLLVTHQLYLAARHAQTLALINGEQGTFVVDQTALLMTGERLSEVFGRPIGVFETRGSQWVVAVDKEVRS